MSTTDYYHWSSVEDGWICPGCERSCLPFYNVSNLSGSSGSNARVSDPSMSSDHNAAHHQSSGKLLKVLSVNVRSLLPKIDLLRSLCSVESYDIVAICESWLSADVLNSEICIDGYNTIRKDRNRHGGGVLLYIKNSIPYTHLQIQHPDLELIMAECHIKSRLYTLGVFYRPLSSSTTQISRLHDILSLLRPQNLSNLVLCGDFNIDQTGNASPLSKVLHDLSLDFNISQVVQEPTRVTATTSSLIDLVLLSNPSSLESCSTLSPIGTSDHFAIEVLLNLPSSKKNPTLPSKFVWLYKSADMPLARDLLSNLPVASPEDNIDTFWKRWQAAFLDAIQRSVPRRTVPIKSSSPWLNSEIRRLTSKRERLFRLFKRSKSSDHLDKYKSLRNTIVSKVRAAKTAFFENLAQSYNDSKKFWSIIKVLNPRPTNSSTLTDGSKVVSADADKAALLNDFFSSCFNKTFVPSSYPSIIQTLLTQPIILIVCLMRCVQL